MWNRQKQWELKREVLFDATRRMSAVFDRLKHLNSLLQVKLRNPATDPSSWAEMSADANTEWFKAVSAPDESTMFVEITCSQEAIRAINKFSREMRTIAAKISKEDGVIFGESVTQLLNFQEEIRVAVRKEIRL